MTLTIKDSTDPASSSKPTLQASNPGQKSGQTPRSNPVCLEVGVTIRSLPTESNSAFQPIREDGRTVIVFDNGAVLRSTSNLPIGQTVILSNPSGRDVICKIVGGRNMPSIKGYVEVEFIEPVDDYWHIHEQNEPTLTVTAQPAAAPPASAPLETPTPRAAEKPATGRTGSGPSFDDIAGVMNPPNRPTTREKKFEPVKPVGEARAKSEPVQTPAGPSGSASSSSTQGSWSESWNEKAEMQAAREAASGDSLSSEWSADFGSDGLLGSTHSSSSIFTDGMPLRIAGAALLLAVIGGGMYFMQRNSAPGQVAQGAGTKQPSLPGTPTAGATNSGSQTVAPPQVPAPDALQAAKAQPALAVHADPVASIAAAASSAVVKDLPGAQRQDKSTQDKGTSAEKISDASSPRSQAIPNLKMKAPSAPKQDLAGQNEAPALVAEIAPPVGAGGASSPGLLSSVVRLPNQPPPPPSRLPAKANRDAKLISSAHAVYPQAAKVANIQGSVVVLATIDPNGNVVDVRAERGPMLLRQAALESVRRWKYSPALTDGKPASTQVAVTVDFKLN